MRVRLVLDTNIWLDWLVFEDPSVAPLCAAVESGRAEVVIDAEGERELERALGYSLGRFTLSEDEQTDCLDRCRRTAIRYDGDSRAAELHLPRCSDPDDQKFLELAAACGATHLVTKDRALLVLARRELPFSIVGPGEVE